MTVVELPTTIRTEEIPVDEYLEIPDIFGGQDGDYMVQVTGASFDSLAIMEGDYLVVRPTDKPGKCAVKVAFRGDGNTASTALLLAAAEELPAGAKLCGQVIGVMRKV